MCVPAPPRCARCSFFNKVTALASPAYVPSEEDVLRSRVRTSGIIEETYDIGGVEFIIYDVGGQRNERKKWIHCFDQVTAVIFVASLSEYDQVLFEDATVNRMVEAINLFSEICNSKWFEHSSMILFLNKKDLFAKKIQTIDVRHEGGDGTPPRFLDYTGGCDYDKAKRYITERFTEHNRRTDASQVRPAAAAWGGCLSACPMPAAPRLDHPRSLLRVSAHLVQLTVHVTCATDTGNVRVVFETCKEAILRKNIEGSGFMET